MWSLVPVYSKWTGCEDGQEGAHWLCTMRHGILWFKRSHNRLPRKSSPRGNRRLAPPQASPTHCDICHWSAIYWSGLFSTALHIKLGSGFRGPEVSLSLVDTTATTTTENGVCADALETDGTGPLPDFRSTPNPGPDIRTLVLPILTRSPFPSILVFQRISFSCSSSSDSVTMTRLSAYRFSNGHPVQNSWERAFRTAMNSRGLSQEPWWTPTFTLNSSLTNTHSASDIFMHALYEPHQPLNLKLVNSPSDDTTGFMIECLFQIDKCHVQYLVDGMELLL